VVETSLCDDLLPIDGAQGNGLASRIDRPAGAAIGKPILLAFDEPGNCFGQSFPLFGSRVYLDGEPVGPASYDLPLYPPEVFDIEDHSLGGISWLCSSDAIPPGNTSTVSHGNSLPSLSM